jgi:hypothetical protein
MLVLWVSSLGANDEDGGYLEGEHLKDVLTVLNLENLLKHVMMRMMTTTIRTMMMTAVVVTLMATMMMIMTMVVANGEDGGYLEDEHLKDVLTVLNLEDLLKQIAVVVVMMMTMMTVGVVVMVVGGGDHHQ